MHNGVYCGHPEAFTIPGKWEKTDLTWWLGDPYKPLKVMSRKYQFGLVKQALEKWGKVSSLTFKAAMRGRADLYVGFVGRDHDDGSPFDGPGGVLAHAYIPSDAYEHILEGDIHMDEEEQWEVWVDTLTVLIHEAGHALGIGHSADEASIMYPWYKGINHNLGADDIAAIQALYGGA